MKTCSRNFSSFLLAFLFVATCIFGCKSTSDVANNSSIQKRKYRKGYYIAPKSKKEAFAVADETTNETESNTEKSSAIERELEEKATVDKNADALAKGDSQTVVKKKNGQDLASVDKQEKVRKKGKLKSKINQLSERSPLLKRTFESVSIAIPSKHNSTQDPVGINQSSQRIDPVGIVSFASGLLIYLLSAAAVPGLGALAFLFMLSAIICGHISLNRIKRDPTLRGTAFPIIGLVLGYLAVLLIVIVIIAVIAALSTL